MVNDESGKLKVQIKQLAYISRPPKLLCNCVRFPCCRAYVTDFTKGVREKPINPSVKSRKTLPLRCTAGSSIYL